MGNDSGHRNQSQPQTQPGNIRELRLLIPYRDTLRALCKVVVTRRDASLYVLPYGPLGLYYASHHRLPEQHTEGTFNFVEQLDAPLERAPKLSLHESGQAHVNVGETRIGPTQTPPLRTLRGEHVATVTADTLAGLAVYERPAHLTGAERDFLLSADEGVKSGRVAIYINGERASFRDPCPIWLTLERPTLYRPLYVGIRPASQLPLTDPADGAGVTVIGGWDSDVVSAGSDADFLTIRAE